MRRTKYIVANWKMNPPTLAEAIDIFNAIKGTAGRANRVTTIIVPPLAYLSFLKQKYTGNKIHFGAQNVFFEAKGPFTGEISVPMLKSVGVEYVIVGHSERRALGETSEIISKKTDAALRRGMKAILCVGERSRDRHGDYLGELRDQVLESVASVSRKHLVDLLIAYEPVWAISTVGEGEVLAGKDVHETILYIRKILSEKYDKSIALSIPILYGGSVDKANAGEILAEGGVNGLLVGGASLTPHQFNMIVSIAHKGI